MQVLVRIYLFDIIRSQRWLHAYEVLYEAEYFRLPLQRTSSMHSHYERFITPEGRKKQT